MHTFLPFLVAPLLLAACISLPPLPGRQFSHIEATTPLTRMIADRFGKLTRFADGKTGLDWSSYYNDLNFDQLMQASREFRAFCKAGGGEASNRSLRDLLAVRIANVAGGIPYQVAPTTPGAIPLAESDKTYAQAREQGAFGEFRCRYTDGREWIVTVIPTAFKPGRDGAYARSISLQIAIQRED